MNLFRISDLGFRILHLPPALALALVTVLWGLSFPLMKNWQEAAQNCPGGPVLASLTLIAIRMILAVGVLAVIRPGLLTRPSRREHALGMRVGEIFFLGFVLQVLGLAWATPALSAFITSLASVWVPLLGFLWFRTRVPRSILTGLVCALAGAVVLAKVGDPELAITFGPGEWFTLASSLVFAVQILFLDRGGRHIESANLTFGFMGSACMLAVVSAALCAGAGSGIGVWISWTVSMLRSPAIVRDVLILTLFSTVVAFHLMNVYQPKVSAEWAALIYLLEPIFAAIFSVGLGHERFTWRLLVGGGLILAGNLLASATRSK